jgi:hypothetical protein
MPILSISSRAWSKGTHRYFTRGRSAKLRAIDDALDDYHVKAAVSWSSAATEAALDALADAIDDWSAGKGTKGNGHIDSCRDSKGLVSRLRTEIDLIRQAIAATVEGRQRKAKAMHEKSVQKAKAKDIERGAAYKKNAQGKFEKTIYGQEKTNSCTCACSCTFSGYLADQQLREDVFRAAYNRINGVMHDFETKGTFLPPIARTLQSLGVDAAHVPTADWPALKAGLMKGRPDAPVMLGVYWAGGGGHAILCKGPGTVRWTDDLGHAQTAPGFLIEDPWPTHADAMMFDDGEYWVRDTARGRWSHGSAASNAGYIFGKKSLGLRGQKFTTRQGVKVM